MYDINWRLLSKMKTNNYRCIFLFVIDARLKYTTVTLFLVRYQPLTFNVSLVNMLKEMT